MISNFAGSTVNLLLKDSPLLNLIGALVGCALLYFAVRWAVPADELQQPAIRLRVMRIAVLSLAVLVSLLSLYMLSSLAMWIGNTLEVRLGSIGFLGTFIADLGDILGMTLTVISALAGAGVLMSLTDRLGRKIIKATTKPMAKGIMMVMSAIAGAALFFMIMAGLDWLYQFKNAALTIAWPLGLGALLGLILSIRLNPRDNFPIGLVIYYIARTIFNALRSIEALIMVIVFVVWVGIGPFAGVLALSLHTIAALAKLYSEQVESILPGPLEAIKATGANRLQTIVYAVVPQIIPPYISFTMYRWDINVRMSTIIGFAGGGGIGFLLIQNINLLNYRAASAQMLAIALVVASMDYISSRLREETI
ncbi:MAG: ABC transporter permease subunit [Anaerolineae bacterium]|nr:ABC transporter permease subunit [Anaerolineae bacterium]